MSFTSLIGNERNKAILQRLLGRGGAQLGRTLIFSGPDGIGKRQFALTMAKAANCLTPSPSGIPDSCDSCATCRRIEEGTYGDVIQIVPDGQFIRIAQTRAMNEEVFARPREGRQRFFIIDEADRLREEAANSLLKTLEEPPATSSIILITPRPDTLLRTIRSRAQRLAFTPLTIPEMEAYLNAGYPRPAGENALLARLAAGRLGAALTIDLSVYRQERRILLELLELLVENRYRYRIMKAAEYLAKKERKEFELALVSLVALLRDLLIIDAGRAADVVNVDLTERLGDLASRIGSTRIIRWMEHFNELLRQQRFNVNRQLAAEALLLELPGMV